ncbi:MAG: alpha/beta fold hydrolase [Actinomycetota bacterium]|nr:alpha/beta fold hydrolase [Actinomycetota bacterium]
MCFPHSGGGPSAFSGWVTGLAPHVEVWHVTLPGRATRLREPFAREWEPLVHELVETITETVPRPFAVFGHSLGATIAFEVTRALSRNGIDPTHLVVSARPAPDTPHTWTVPQDDNELLRHVDQVYGGIPDAICAVPDLLQYFLTVIRADLELSTKHVFKPGPRLRIPVTALGGDSDPTVSTAQLQRWGAHTEAEFRVHQLPGGHFYLNDQEALVLDTILRRLLPVVSVT